MAPLYMILAPVGALDGIRGRSVVHQVNASCCKGMCTLIEVLLKNINYSKIGRALLIKYFPTVL